MNLRRRLRHPQLVEFAAAPEAPRGVEREVPLDVVDRVLDVGMLVVILRQEDRGAEIDRLPPPLGQDLALDLDPLHHVGVGRRRDRRDDLVGDQRDRRRRRRVDAHPDRIAEEISGRTFPVLAFPLVHVHPHRVPVGAREARVDVDERLHPVLAGGDVGKAADGMAAILGAERHRCAGLQLIDVLRKSGTPSGSVC